VEIPVAFIRPRITSPAVPVKLGIKVLPTPDPDVTADIGVRPLVVAYVTSALMEPIVVPEESVPLVATMTVAVVGRDVDAVTVSVVDALIIPDVAVIVLVPALTPVANPFVAIVAADGFDELQVMEPVIFCVELSEYVPVAVNCWVVPIAMPGLAGVTAMDTNFGGDT
jgi:hypothetical protein